MVTQPSSNSATQTNNQTSSHIDSQLQPPMHSHNALVSEQFSPKANAYLTSAVHAAGADLDQMAQWLGQLSPGIALDMGCGAGHAAFRLAPLMQKVVACDLSDAMLQVLADEARVRGLHNLITKCSAAETLPCPDASFDVAVSRYSAHHWHDWAAGLAQMRRALKPGGTAVFMDVVAPANTLCDTWLQSLELLRDPSHVRNASIAQWESQLTALGFDVVQVVPYRLRLEFASWVARMQTPPPHVAAIRALQHCASAAVRDYFAIEADGSWTVDTVCILARG